MTEEIIIQIPIRCKTYRKMIDTITWGSIVGFEIVGGLWFILDIIGMTGNYITFVRGFDPASTILIVTAIAVPYLVFIITALAAVVLGCAKAAEWISKFKFKCIPDEEKP